MLKNETDFEKIVSRLDIDTKPNPAHREKLRRQMLSAFNETTRVKNTISFWRTIMKSKTAKLAAAAVIIIAGIAGIYHFIKPIETTIDELRPIGIRKIEIAAAKVAPIEIKLPKEMFVGTPLDIRVPNLEKPLGKPRPPFYAPVGTKNVSLGKPVSSSDKEPIIGEIEMITDGDKEASDGSYVELGPFVQHVTIDLEATYEIYAIVVWHYHKQPTIYFDVVVQVADDADFITNVRTLFNNDIDNSSGLGVGKNMHYVETYEGKLIDAKGVRARYIRLYSNGNNGNDMNHYTEVSVYGKPAQ